MQKQFTFANVATITVILIVYLLGAVFPARVFAQPLEASVLNLNHQGFPNVSLNLTVRSAGRTVSNIPASSFTLTENGQRQIISVLSSSATANVRLVDIVFVLDVSTSMRQEIAAVKRNINSFINTLAQSNMDYRVGFIVFADALYVYNNGELYSRQSDILTIANQINISDKNVDADNAELDENALEAMATASTMRFRDGAMRVQIMLTDAAAHEGNFYTTRTVQSLIRELKTNSNLVFPIFTTTSRTQQQQYIPIAQATNPDSSYYNILSNFNEIITDIQGVLSNSYSISYRSTNPTIDGTSRTVRISINNNGSSASATTSFVPGSAPQIRRTQETISLRDRMHPEGTIFTIAAAITDAIIPFVSTATLSYRRITSATINPYQSIPMRLQGGNNYSASIPAGIAKSPGVEYFITASDGVSTISDPYSQQRIATHQISIFPNELPSISIIDKATSVTPNTPITITARISDRTQNLTETTLFYRVRNGQIRYKALTMRGLGNDLFSATIPANENGEQGLEYYVYAEDNFNTFSSDGTEDNPNLLLPAQQFGGLIITATPETEQTAAPGETLRYTLAVRDANNQLVADATIAVQDNLQNQSRTLITDATGQVEIVITVPSSTAAGVYNLIFTATKAGIASSTTLGRSIRIQDQSTNTKWDLNFALGKIQGSVRTIATDGDMVYFGGRITSVNGQPANNIVAWDRRNNTWSTLNGGITENDAIIYSLAVHPAGIFVGGSFGKAGSTECSNLAFWNKSSLRWQNAFGGVKRVDNLRAAVQAIAIEWNKNTIYIGGYFDDVGQVGTNGISNVRNIAAFYIQDFQNFTGKWSKIGNGLEDGVKSLLISNKVLYASTYFNNPDQVFAWNPDSNPLAWQNISTSPIEFTPGSQINSMAEDIDGNIYIAGSFTIKTPFQNISHLARFDPFTKEWTNVANIASGVINSICSKGAKLYLGGKFTISGQSESKNIGIINLVQNTGEEIDNRINNQTIVEDQSIQALAIDNSDDLYISTGLSRSMPQIDPVIGRYRKNLSDNVLYGNVYNPMFRASNGRLSYIRSLGQNGKIRILDKNQVLQTAELDAQDGSFILNNIPEYHSNFSLEVEFEGKQFASFFPSKRIAGGYPPQTIILPFNMLDYLNQYVGSLEKITLNREIAFDLVNFDFNANAYDVDWMRRFSQRKLFTNPNDDNNSWSENTARLMLAGEVLKTGYTDADKMGIGVGKSLFSIYEMLSRLKQPAALKNLNPVKDFRAIDAISAQLISEKIFELAFVIIEFISKNDAMKSFVPELAQSWGDFSAIINKLNEKTKPSFKKSVETLDENIKEEIYKNIAILGVGDLLRYLYFNNTQPYLDNSVRRVERALDFNAIPSERITGIYSEARYRTFKAIKASKDKTERIDKTAENARTVSKVSGILADIAKLSSVAAGAFAVGANAVLDAVSLGSAAYAFGINISRLIQLGSSGGEIPNSINQAFSPSFLPVVENTPNALANYINSKDRFSSLQSADLQAAISDYQQKLNLLASSLYNQSNISPAVQGWLFADSILQQRVKDGNYQVSAALPGMIRGRLVTDSIYFNSYLNILAKSYTSRLSVALAVSASITDSGRFGLDTLNMIFAAAIRSQQYAAKSIDSVLRLTSNIPKPAYLAVNNVITAQQIKIGTSQPMVVQVTNFGDTSIENVWVKLTLTAGFQSDKDSLLIAKLSGNQSAQLQFSIQAPLTVTTGSYLIEFVNIGERGTLPVGNLLIAVTQATSIQRRVDLIPTGFRLLTPPNNAGNISPASITFRWVSALPSVYYNFQIATDPLFIHPLLNEHYTDTTKMITGFNLNRWYFWRVRPLGGDWSSVWSFYTGTLSGQTSNFSSTTAQPQNSSEQLSSQIPSTLRQSYQPNNGEYLNALTLRQHPNPFNHTTTLEYVLPREGAHVRMDVCNMLGQTLLTPVNGTKAAGAHTVDVTMDGFPSGVYVVRMSVGGQVLTRQMTLIR